MHELSIVENIFSITMEKAEQAKAKTVSKVNLVIGELSGVVDECVIFYFGLISKDTIAAGATLSIKHSLTQFRCRNCSRVFKPEGQNWTCPECGRKDIEIISGRDLYIESLEVE